MTPFYLVPRPVGIKVDSDCRLTNERTEGTFCQLLVVNEDAKMLPLWLSVLKLLMLYER